MHTKQGYEGTRTIFLDRDGVINRKAPEGEYVSRWDVFHPLPGVVDAILRLNQAGLPVYVVTNQRGVSLGLYTEDEVETLHSRLQEELATSGAHVDGFYFCPHGKAECTCRKPLPGMFEQAKLEHPDIRFEASVMVGDSLSDMEAGQRLGMRTIFIDGATENQKPGAEKARGLAEVSCASLLEAVELILGERE